MVSAFCPRSNFHSSGQCGNQIGNAFWNTEKLANDGILQEIKMIQPINVNWIKFIYFKEAGALRCISRASLDLEPHSLDVIKASPISLMLSDSLDVFDASGAGNNWTTGHYTEGAELIGESMRLSTRFS